MNLIWDYIGSFYSGKKTYIIAFLITEYIGIGFLTPAVDLPYGSYSLKYFIYGIFWLIFNVYHFYIFPYILNENFFEPITKWDSYNSLFGKFMRYLTAEREGRRTLLLYVWMIITMWFIWPIDQLSY
jgi:hypothetical protein